MVSGFAARVRCASGSVQSVWRSFVAVVELAKRASAVVVVRRES